MKPRKKSIIEAEFAMKKFLNKIGYKECKDRESINDIPDYKIKSNIPKTSDNIPGKSPKKAENFYTGNEIMGIVVTHKSNLVPIRRDNKQAAIDASQMRRS
jgi:hypothetical protein